MELYPNLQDSAGKELPQYSVLMSVYAGDTPSWVEEAIDSMATQSYRPDEIVLIEDGPISDELRVVVENCIQKYPQMIRDIKLEKNVGLGEAMRIGVMECRNEWLARMDADDISAPTRCEEQLIMAEAHGADIVGCDSEEFIEGIDQPIAKRLFPESHEELVRFSRRKVPFCHPAVMMRKSAVLRAGNYHNVYPHDDYDIFVRMLASGSIGYTIKKILFHVRVNEGFYKRRGGLRYIKTLLSYNWQLLKSGWTSPVDFFVRSCGNIIIGLSPVPLRTWLYRRLLRK
ncbi:MAG: glycosyltransferase [Clostridiales bacterium]|nr:glycosyltransferase [Clostridiales bacterium]